VAGDDRRPLVVGGLLVAIVAIGLLKPWGGGPGPASPGAISAGAARPSTLAVVAPATPSQRPSPDPHTTISGPCYYGLAQRLFTTDTTSNGLVQTWYGLDPVAASGPADAAIPVVSVHSRTLGQLGYCLVTGQAAEAHVVATRAWQLSPGGEPRALDLERAAQVAPDDPDQGAVYGPPAAISGSHPGIWPAATYVFEIQLQASPAEWFAVRVS
jgi:hypothetical protein